MAARSSASDANDTCKRQSGVGMAHLTVVPTNFDRETTRCPNCGKPLAEH